jgi:hypothetical protein
VALLRLNTVESELQKSENIIYMLWYTPEDKAHVVSAHVFGQKESDSEVGAVTVYSEFSRMG